ncbi:5-histidylcysteine sulfoxide synthase [Ferrimonas aestuarii]|uniref:5-histidylcysteine sulfoxide synthase n=1 Tax=Ferrimonas aestuarii TaxID=2569539 RepID=A0A4U1BQS6_9GAMM|nr:5-histidylcysteine sulfoxide synthase [Ferrimonas aestuarii]TKB57421.1 5-histidylcysteine sulfoxide synthase [Ferrimonas aestuarii]
MEQLLQTPSLHGDNIEQKRAEIKAYFNQSWTLYESLFEVIKADASYYLKAEPLRHPLVFYFGHTATFFINKLKLAKLIEHRINPKFESMFAVGVDEMSWDDLDEKNYDWPQISEVRDYRDRVSVLVNRFIDTMELSLPITPDSPAWLILMGIEHERIHLETSSVIIRQLPLDDVQPHSNWSACEKSSSAPRNALVDIEGGNLILGRPQHSDGYGWDNEYGNLPLTLADFKASQFLVSNQEFLEFVTAGGYQQSQYWDEEGKHWLSFQNRNHPRFWVKHGENWLQRNLTEEIPLPLNWPVEVNQLEAAAFCRWKSDTSQEDVRLPTEAEWQLLRQQVPENNPQWQSFPGNIHLAQYASSTPVDANPQGALYDIVGNVWQWTQSTIDGFNGFEVHPLYDDFSTPTFDGKHNLMKGGSWISTGNESLPYSRYAFRRHFFQHCGFRYVSSEQAPTLVENNVYETDTMVSQYLEFHYGDRYFNVDNFCESAVNVIVPHLSGRARALDIGCSVGRSSIELARHFAHVDGIDFSARFIQQGWDLINHGHKRYTIATEGELVDYKSVSLEALNAQDLVDNIHFSQGDACNLKPQFTQYDLVLASNLLDRLANPTQFLNQIGERLTSDGVLVLLSPYTWLEEFTPKEQWLGAKKIDGETLSSFEAINELLCQEYQLLHRQDLPFVIRETRRKFQHSVSELTIWKKL